MKPIGGFFELEIIGGKSLYHDKAIKLSTGRACLNYILKILKPTKVYLPYYCCDALFEPIILNGIDFEFYSINEQLEINVFPKLRPTEVIIWTDFFGIKTNYVNDLLDKYKDKLIIDNTHSFFLQEYKTDNYSFTSARKYFGVPDGAFLYGPKHLITDVTLKRNCNISINHNLHRLIGLQEKAYKEYTEYEKILGSDIELISVMSEKVLSTIDYSEVRKRRNENFNYFRKEFGEINKLNIDTKEKDCFCYPLLAKKTIERKRLYKESIFVPNLWSDTLNREQKNNFQLECKLSSEILPLPIDHRYSLDDLSRVSNILKTIMSES